nr:unnamed protein product [Digitaria exilis]
MCTSASTVEVGVPLVPLGTDAPVAVAVGGVDALVVGAPARVVRGVALGGAAPAAAGVPDGPVEHDGHGEVAGPVEEGLVTVIEPGGLHQEHVVARRGIDGECLAPLPLLEPQRVGLVEVHPWRYRALAAPHAGAGTLPRDGVLRRPAHGRAPADEGLRLAVDEVTEGRAAQRDEAVLGRGEEVGADAEGHDRASPAARERSASMMLNLTMVRRGGECASSQTSSKPPTESSR